MRLTWAQPEDLVAAELATLREQGVDSAALWEIEREWTAAGGNPVLIPSGASDGPADARLRELGRELLDRLAALAPHESDLPDDASGAHPRGEQRRGASGERGTAPAPERLPIAETPSFDRFHGAWLGRAIGCLLGKPVEKIPREGIEAIARATGNWPIVGYFTARGLPAEIAARWPWNRRSAPTSLVENIDGMPEDDDLNFPLLALDLMERHGAQLTTEQVADAWLQNLPGGRVFTAERAAYRNLLDARPIPETATYRNPFREWIGALIRADVYGWVSPGDLAEAARLARVDARLSHTGEGIRGAEWAAALTSASLVAADVTSVLTAAQSVLPRDSRLALAVRHGQAIGVELAQGTVSLEEALDDLHAAYGQLHWVHTVNNAALIACALEGSRGDLGRGIAIAVAGGWDTDSAGATVGSVLGGLSGAAAIDPAWSAPLHDSLATSLPGGATRSIADLARRTHALAEGRAA